MRLHRGEPAALFILEETPDQLRQIARGFGGDPGALEARGALHLHYASPVELSTDRFLNEVRDRMTRIGARRVVLDSLSEIRLLAQSSLRYRRQILAIKHYFAKFETTVILLDDLTAEEHIITRQEAKANN